MPFSSEIRAMKDQDAIERIYTDMGSRHKAKRREIKLTHIEELKSVETETAKSGK
jgi:large subunit ribosomal protein LX